MFLTFTHCNMYLFVHGDSIFPLNMKRVHVQLNINIALNFI